MPQAADSTTRKRQCLFMFCALIFSALFLFFQLKKNSLERPSVLAFNRLNGCYWKVFFLLLFDCYFYFLDYLIRMAGLERGFALLQQSWFSFEIASCFLCLFFFIFILWWISLEIYFSLWILKPPRSVQSWFYFSKRILRRVKWRRFRYWIFLFFRPKIWK